MQTPDTLFMHVADPLLRQQLFHRTNLTSLMKVESLSIPDHVTPSVVETSCQLQLLLPEVSDIVDALWQGELMLEHDDEALGERSVQSIEMRCALLVDECEGVRALVRRALRVRRALQLLDQEDMFVVALMDRASFENPMWPCNTTPGTTEHKRVLARIVRAADWFAGQNIGLWVVDSPGYI